MHQQAEKTADANGSLTVVIETTLWIVFNTLFCFTNYSFVFCLYISVFFFYWIEKTRKKKITHTHGFPLEEPSKSDTNIRANRN